MSDVIYKLHNSKPNEKPVVEFRADYDDDGSPTFFMRRVGDKEWKGLLSIEDGHVIRWGEETPGDFARLGLETDGNSTLADADGSLHG